ncbi:MAG: class I SAM-dependent methyltransferase, partial [Candidatus Obscuribacterales bacterium]|nr:class I SAM-dependent methyltransferase [Candidatus Obscuribacterales bacterium]
MSSTSGIDKKKIPFVTYYSENNISPVAQDVSDIRKHMERRDSLYRHLGIPSNLVRDKSIIEFGPGSGHNSIHTLHLNPRRYVLVEGNPSGLDSVKELLTPLAGSAQVEFVQSLIEDYRSAQKFDIVLCEGVIPLQLDPENFTKHVASFVNDGGILVITCTDSISLASEVIRKICTALLIDDSLSIEEKIEILLPVFTPHLDTLKGISRFYRDWILDVLLHDW